MSTSGKAKRKQKRAEVESSKTKESWAKGPGLVVAVVLIAIVTLALVWNGLQSTYGPSSSTTSVLPVKRTYPALDIKLAEGNSSWVRGENDLPSYKTTLKWNICNEGTATANDTRVIGLLDGAVVRDYVWPAIPANGCQNGDVDLNLQYDTTHRFVVNASSGVWSNSTFLEIRAGLPRFLLDPQAVPSDDLLEYAKLFVTPNDPIVKEASDRVFRESSTPNYSGLKLSDLCPNLQAGGKCPDWMVLNAAEQWVGGHITREGFTQCRFVNFECGDIQETRGYAHLPRETLQSRMGDPLDIAVLIVSLARAAGLSPNEIFAVLGTNGTVSGAWIYESTKGQLWPSTSGLSHPCECNALVPACCAMRAVYYFSDQVATLVS